uniref:biotin--protein ligase isoform X2 n=1 Tax=Myxine glutinosa TaxID=7769 RepID=UPI0035901734
MLLTLCYAYLYYRLYYCSSAQAALIRRALQAVAPEASLCFCGAGGAWALPQNRCRYGTAVNGALSTETRGILAAAGSRVLAVIKPKVCVDISGWEAADLCSGIFNPELVTFLLEAGHSCSTFTCYPKEINWPINCTLLAYKSEDPCCMLAEVTEEAFVHLGVAFLQNVLDVELGFEAQALLSVALQGMPSKCEGDSGKVLKEPGPTFPCRLDREPSGEGVCRSTTAAVILANRPEDQAETIEEAGVLKDNGETPGCHHPLHLASCCECLELESSTIESLRSASMDNIVELPLDEAHRLPERQDSLETLVSIPLDTVAGDTMLCKPPNVLVYTGKETKEAEDRFTIIAQALGQCLTPNSYTIYRLRHMMLTKDPWPAHTRLLVLASTEQLEEPELREHVFAYLAHNGRVLALCCSFTYGHLTVVTGRAEADQQPSFVERIRFSIRGSPEVTFTAPATGTTFRVDTNGDSGMHDAEVWARLDGPEQEAVIVYQTWANGGAVISSEVDLVCLHKVAMHCHDNYSVKICNSVLSEILTTLELSCGGSETPHHTPVFLYSINQRLKSTFLKCVGGKLETGEVICGKKLRLKFMATCEPGSAISLSSAVPVVTEMNDFQPTHFDPKKYFTLLRSQHLGQLLLYAEVISSTMELFDGLEHQLPTDGLVVVATQQTKGRGRAGNVWLSPVGSAMFTLYLSIPLNSRLGQRLPFLQHLVALAVVQAVRTSPGYEDVALKIKWPNDVYYGSTVKIGGVLVTTSLMDSTFHAAIGCGVNVSNSRPTTSINEAVSWHNKEHGTALSPLAVEDLVAGTVSSLEQLVEIFQSRGPDGILPLYYSRWLHSGARVRLGGQQGPEASVVQLDSMGFLEVLKDSGQLVSVQPDGNSFDLLHNLILCKQ